MKTETLFLTILLFCLFGFVGLVLGLVYAVAVWWAEN